MPEDIDNFPPALEESLDSIIKNEGYVTYDVEKKPISTKGIGFLAKPFLVTIKGNTKHGVKETNVYVKAAPTEGNMDDLLDIPRAYRYESFVYNELSKVFAELEQEAGIPEKDRFKLIRSYGVSNTKGIFLENVAIQGYECAPRIATVTLQVAEVAIKEIAKFHAFSFIIQERKPDFYKCFENMKTPIGFNKSYNTVALNMAKIALKHLTEDSKVKMERFLENYLEKFKNYLSGVDARTRCLCHGDFRLHNLLMKQTGEKLDLLVVDYQLINTNSPINDLLYFMFIGTDGTFRRKYFEHIKNVYYDFFTGFLKKFHIDSAKIYPRREFEKDFRERLDFGLCCVLYFFPFMLADENDIPEVEDMSANPNRDIKMHECFPERLQDIVDEYIEWGVL